MRPVVTAVVALVALLYTGCATEMGNHRHAQHGRDQIELTRVQVESRERMALDRAQAQANWALAMAQVAQASPESADAIAVALAVSAVKGNSDESKGPLVTLQRQENNGLEWAKVLASPVLGTLTQLGIAGINGEVQKNASDNMAKIQINEDNVDQAQYEVLGNVATSVSTFATNAVQSSGGNTTYTYTASDEATLDLSTTTTTSGDTTSGDTNSDSYNTSGDTNTDSYNTTGDTNADSYNTSGDTTTDSSDNSDNSTTDSSDNSDNSTGGS